MKVILLNDGGYIGLENVEFPVEVEASRDPSGYLARVSKIELVKVGADGVCFDVKCLHSFVLDDNCELVEEEL